MELADVAKDEKSRTARPGPKVKEKGGYRHTEKDHPQEQ